MKSVITSITVLLVLFSINARGAEADSTTTDNSKNSYSAWVQIGGGFSTMGVTGRAGLFVSKNSNFLAFRAGGGGDVAIFSESANKYSEYGLMVGRKFNLIIFEPYLAAGLAYTSTRQNSVDTQGPGVMLEGHMGLGLLFFGLGVTGFVNINPTVTITGIVFELQLGSM